MPGMPEQRTHDYVRNGLTTPCSHSSTSPPFRGALHCDWRAAPVPARTRKPLRPTSGSGAKGGTKDHYSAPSRICRSNPSRADDVPVDRNAPSHLPERGCRHSDVVRRRKEQARAALRTCSECAYHPTAQLPPQTVLPGPPESLDTVFGR
ncbi:Hypothetical protein SLIV_37402 [Streptomyces lividans TK24]|uniref:Uncharacterized protein n=1 Tax=Streptomyces lividans TK24 TaxID=457428 RepID=A0ABX6TPT6_STRLI|nr:Hypothetical protein SLIV_37402 [Streptomyces lividans TK24]QSJ13976.1 Hypothetical protein SLIVDG2_37402 [Streptomyces lividans]QTD74886.1 Hypothetical protein SLIVYQS_37402 [Streptomyces lividans TK24] [Streptomyces lividans]